jgi:hypothetical protein
MDDIIGILAIIWAIVGWILMFYLFTEWNCALAGWKSAAEGWSRALVGWQETINNWMDEVNEWNRILNNL